MERGRHIPEDAEEVGDEKGAEHEDGREQRLRERSIL